MEAVMTQWPNKPDAVNPAIASRLAVEHHWRGVTGPGRSARSHPMNNETQTTTNECHS